MRLWVEHAYQSWGPAGPAAPEEVDSCVCTLRTEEQFWALLVGSSQVGAVEARSLAGRIGAMLERGMAPDSAVAAALGDLPAGTHMPVSLLHVGEGARAHVVESDAPPLFLTRRAALVLLPVVEEEAGGRLVRQCRFDLQEGDHLAMVSEAYIHARGWDRRWGWRDIALSIRRLTETGGDAERLLGALLGMYRRLARGGPARPVTVVAMHVRPVRVVTVWSGPPGDPADDARAVGRLMSESGRRVICGDTTAAIAARVLGRTLEQEPRPAAGWAEVPPTWRLEGVDLVTEGVVTLRSAHARLAAARRAADLPRADDGATRLARLLLEADVVRFLIGTAVNPAQREGGVSWRQEVLAGLSQDLRAYGKVVHVEEIGG